MAQITIPIPTIEHWRTTLFGLMTAAGGAALQYLQNGGLSWRECAVAAAWAGLCYLVPDAQHQSPTNQQISLLVESAVAARLADIGRATKTEATVNAGA